MHTPNPDEAEIFEEFQFATSLFEKILGQRSFEKEDGSFESRLTEATGRLNIPANDIEILIQQQSRNGIRTMVVAKHTNGMPFASCIIPGDDEGESARVCLAGPYQTIESFYEYVLALLPDKGVTQEEGNQLIADQQQKVDDILNLPPQN